MTTEPAPSQPEPAADAPRAVVQKSLRDIIQRFSYLSQGKHGLKSKPMQLSKLALKLLNTLVVENIHRLFDPRAQSFVPSLTDADRVRLEHAWFARTVREACERGRYGPIATPTNRILVVWRKQVEQHLTHLIICACNTALNQHPPRATIVQSDIANLMVFLVAVLMRPDAAGINTPPTGIQTMTEPVRKRKRKRPPTSASSTPKKVKLSTMVTIDLTDEPPPLREMGDVASQDAHKESNPSSE